MAAAFKEPVGVLGAGRLGLCWALCAEAAGHAVVAADVFPSYVDAINSKKLVTHEPDVATMLRAATRLHATTSVRETAESARMLFIFVQTPSSGGDRHYDHSHLSDILCQLNALRVRDKHLVICCTVMPGYCAQIAPGLLRDCERVTVSYSPAFIAQGEILTGLLAPDLVLLGEGSVEAGDALEAVHRSLLGSSYAASAALRRHGSVAAAAASPPSLRRMSAGSAEIAKLSLNCFVTLKIAFANFVADVADAADLELAAAGGPEGARVDKHAILEALGCDARVGQRCLLPGYGFGGPCFPRDNRALAQHARALGVCVAIPEATDSSNEAHARAQAREVCAGLDCLKAARGAQGARARAIVAVFGDVAYKPRCPVPIVQESQKLTVARLVRAAGWAVLIEDRPDVLDAVRRDSGSLFRYRAYAGAADALSRAEVEEAEEEVDAEAFLRLRKPKRTSRDGEASAERDEQHSRRADDGGVAGTSASDTGHPADAELPGERAAELRGEGRRSMPISFTH